MGTSKRPPRRKLTPAEKLIQRWISFQITCTRKDLGAQSHRVHFGFIFAVSPEFDEMGKGYQVVAEALENEDGGPLEGIFGSFGFDGVFVEFDNTVKAQMGLGPQIQRVYAGERWGLVTEIFFRVLVSDDLLADERTRHLWMLPFPHAVLPLLHVFNVLSSENPTHPFRLHEMWKRLHAIQTFALTCEKEDDLNSEDLFVSRDSVSMRLRKPGDVLRLARLINHFRHDFMAERQDYFAAKAETAEWPLFLIAYRNAFEAFLGSFLGEIVEDYRAAGMMGECDFCRNVFPYVKGKHYCSPTRTSNCGRSARNRRTYLRRGKRQFWSVTLLRNRHGP